jgi:hypothetical protein
MIRQSIVLFGALLCSAQKISAQGYAPQSLPGSSFSVTALTATAPFSTNVFYRFFTPPSGSNCVVIGNAATGLNAGTYSYAKTGANTAAIAFVDAQSGTGFSGQFTFASGNAGATLMPSQYPADQGYAHASLMAAKNVSSSPQIIAMQF